MKSLFKNLIFIIILGAIAYAGYSVFFSSGDSALSGTGSSDGGEVLTREFLIRLGELEQINFSRELFDDPRFQSLSSFSTSPNLVTAGRSEPFSQ